MSAAVKTKERKTKPAVKPADPQLTRLKATLDQLDESVNEGHNNRVVIGMVLDLLRGDDEDRTDKAAAVLEMAHEAADLLNQGLDIVRSYIVDAIGAAE